MPSFLHQQQQDVKPPTAPQSATSLTVGQTKMLYLRQFYLSSGQLSVPLTSLPQLQLTALIENLRQIRTACLHNEREHVAGFMCLECLAKKMEKDQEVERCVDREERMQA